MAQALEYIQPIKFKKKTMNHDKIKNFEVFLIPGNVDSLKILEETKTNNVANIDGETLDYKSFKIGF